MPSETRTDQVLDKVQDFELVMEIIERSDGTKSVRIYERNASLRAPPVLLL